MTLESKKRTTQTGKDSKEARKEGGKKNPYSIENTHTHTTERRKKKRGKQVSCPETKYVTNCIINRTTNSQ